MARDSFFAQQKRVRGQAVQSGADGVQTNAPSSMTAWLNVPGSDRSRRVSAKGWNRLWAELWFTGVSRQNSRARTRLTLPSTTARGLPKAMLITAEPM